MTTGDWHSTGLMSEVIWAKSAYARVLHLDYFRFYLSERPSTMPITTSLSRMVRWNWALTLVVSPASWACHADYGWNRDAWMTFEQAHAGVRGSTFGYVSVLHWVKCHSWQWRRISSGSAFSFLILSFHVLASWLSVILRGLCCLDASLVRCGLVGASSSRLNDYNLLVHVRSLLKTMINLGKEKKNFAVYL